MNGLTKAAQDVLAERQRQDEKWGGPDHDDWLSVAQWSQLIQDYAGWARVMAGMDSYDKARRRLVQVAALALAAAESLDRSAGVPANRALDAQDRFCPKCGHNRDASCVSSIDHGDGRKSCQMCGAEWVEPVDGAAAVATFTPAMVEAGAAALAGSMDCPKNAEWGRRWARKVLEAALGVSAKSPQQENP